MAPKNVTHSTKTHTMGLVRPTPDPFTSANSIFFLFIIIIIFILKANLVYLDVGYFCAIFT
jgi:hypothetical protein